MEVKVEGKKYEVKFAHEKAIGERQPHGPRPMVPIGTKCVISQVNGKKVTTVATGYSRVAKGDQFDRSTGRKVALEKALVSIWPQSKIKYDAESGLKKSIAPARNRECRKQFWSKYFAQIEAPKGK